MRGIWRHISSDEGMTLIEIMIASVILFIVLTALLPLVFQTTQMTAQTQAQTLVNNYVNSLIEEIRALPYTDVGIVGSSTIPGSLEPTRSVTLTNGYVIDLFLDVDWVDDPELDGAKNYKQISIDAEVTAPGKPSAQYSTVTYVWGSDIAPTGPLPTVSFSASSPAADAIVYGTTWPVGGRAETSREGGTIVRIALKVDSDFMPDSSTPPGFADFAMSGTPVDVTWLWDTTARVALLDENGLPLKDETGNTVYAYFSPDGYRVIKVEAWDDLGAYNYVTRRVLVDNYPPSPSPSAALVPYRSREVRASWEPAADGTDRAEAYNLRLYREPKTPSDPASWTVVTGGTTGGATAKVFPEREPFSRYKLEVQSRSVRGLVEDPAVWVSSETTTTAPELTGSYTGTITYPKKGKLSVAYAVNMGITPPTFLPSGQVRYDIWRSQSRSGLGAGVPYRTTSDPTTIADTISDGVKYDPPNGNSTITTPDWYYQVKATFKPATQSTQTFSVWSNVVRVPGVVFDKNTAAGTVSGALEVQW